GRDSGADRGNIGLPYRGLAPQDTSGLSKANRDLRKDSPSYPFPRRYLKDNDVQRGAIVKGINSRRLQKTWGERRTRGGKGMGQAGRPGPIEPPAQALSRESRPPLRPRVS